MKQRCLAGLIVFLIQGIVIHHHPVLGQNSTQSPYSMFGIGKLEAPGTMHTDAMGGAGYGLRSNSFINRLNPAGLTSLDSTSFYYDFGFHLDYSSQESAKGDKEIFDGNFKYMTFALPVTHWWFSSFGLEPLSSIGYDVSTEKIVEGSSSTYREYYNGLGGLSKVYWSNGFKLNDRFSMGGSAAFIWGTLENASSIEVDEGDVYGVDVTRKDRYHGFQFDLGLQWLVPLKGSTTLTLGAVSMLSTDLKGNTSLSVDQYNLDGSVSDSLYYGEDILSSIQFPVVFGGGFCLDFNDRYLMAGDYTFTRWDNVKLGDNIRGEAVNNHAFSFGIEKVKNRFALKYGERINYRLGARYESGYQRIDGELIDDFSLSFGIGLPIQNSKSYLNMNLTAGQLGMIQKGLIRENYLKFGVSFSFYDRWFVKQKYQ